MNNHHHLLSLTNHQIMNGITMMTNKDNVNENVMQDDKAVLVQIEEENEVVIHNKLRTIWELVRESMVNPSATNRNNDCFRNGDNDNDPKLQQNGDSGSNTNDSNAILMNIDAAIQQTVHLLCKEMDSSIVMKCHSIQLYIESIQQHIQQYESTLQNMYKENQQLHATNQNQQQMITNLLQAVQESQTQSQDTSKGIMNEARLRAELSQMTSQRDEALGQAAEYKHKVSLLQDQLMDLKMKCSRLLQQKIQYERINNSMTSGTSTITPSTNAATASFSSLASSNTSNEYYQRKMNESNEKISSLQSILLEKNRQIDDLRYQMERNMSHHQQQHQQKQYFK